MFFCGNDAEAKATVAEILKRFGWDPADMGPAAGGAGDRAAVPALVHPGIPGESLDPRLQTAVGLSSVLLDEDAVRRLLRMEDLIPAMERALSDLSAGQVVQPVRLMLPVAEHKGFFATMPACAREALGAKLVTFYPENEGIPTHHALILLFRPETGEPLVTMDGRLITEMRTAAVSAVATQRLARTDASVLAILGSGVQAGSHLEALRLVREFREVRVWSPRHAAAFAERFGVRAAGSAAEAVRGADTVVVATSSPDAGAPGRVVLARRRT